MFMFPFRPAKAGWLWLVPEVGIAPTSRLFQSRANLPQLLGGNWSSWQVMLLRPSGYQPGALLLSYGTVAEGVGNAPTSV